MKILVVGAGGREHALVWKLAQSAEVICAPGNAGIAEEVPCFAVNPMESDRVVALAKAENVDLVVVGPEDPLVNGLADALRAAGVATFGPGRDGAQIEASKAFSKELMAAASVPTPEFRVFTEAEPAKAYARQRFAEGFPVVVKASGNALGKGVVVCDTEHEAEDAIRRMLVDRVFGDAGREIVIEDRLNGTEFSILSIVGDHNFVSLPIARDHKRIGDGNVGPNTGGMGAFSPVASVPADMVKDAEDRLVAPILAALRQRGIPFRGTLFSGIMTHNGQPFCLEYNARFGDPETQPLMMRLGAGLPEALYAAATGEIVPEIEILSRAAVGVVVASAGYPGDVVKGIPMEIASAPEGSKVFHAGTKMQLGRLTTNGGRVVCAVGTGQSVEEARACAYKAADTVTFLGAYRRSDIAAE
jgi:phosphoribosylamine--glycine ligase